MTRPSPLALAFALAVAAAGSSAAFAGPVAPAAFTLTGEDGKSTSVTRADLASLPHTAAAITHEGKTYGFKGVLPSDLLTKVEASLGKAMRGAALSDVVIVKAKDGYTVVLALSDLEASIRPSKIVLADADDQGAALGEKDGPFRLVVDGDLRPARSERNVVSIEVRRLAQP